MQVKDLKKMLDQYGDEESIALDNGDQILYDFNIVDGFDGENDDHVILITE